MLVIAAARETRETKEALGLGLDSGGRGDRALSHPWCEPIVCIRQFFILDP